VVGWVQIDDCDSRAPKITRRYAVEDARSRRITHRVSKHKHPDDHQQDDDYGLGQLKHLALRSVSSMIDPVATRRSVEAALTDVAEERRFAGTR
jgi:uncharacterized membrane protein